MPGLKREEQTELSVRQHRCLSTWRPLTEWGERVEKNERFLLPPPAALIPVQSYVTPRAPH